MQLDMFRETGRVLWQLEKADGYLACEKIIQDTLRVWIAFGCSDKETERYLGALQRGLEKAWVESPAPAGIHFRYASAYAKTLLSGSCWRGWLRQDP
jgi:hypothetical protein